MDLLMAVHWVMEQLALTYLLPPYPNQKSICLTALSLMKSHCVSMSPATNVVTASSGCIL